MKFLFWLIVVLVCPKPSIQQWDLFTQYVADASMYSPQMDGSPPIELEYEEYYTPKRTPATTSSTPMTTQTPTTTAPTTTIPTTTTTTSTTTTTPADLPTENTVPSNRTFAVPSQVRFQSHVLCIVVLAIGMINLFAILFFINGNCSRPNNDELPHIDTPIDNGLESIAVLEVPERRSEIYYERFIPRDIDGNALAVLREDSQENF